ncbi:hypothetical protein D9M70_504190 [compost metagenome]
MQVNGDEEEGCAVGVHVAQQPTLVDVAHDLFDRVERNGRFGGVVHRQNDTGEDLDDQHHRKHGTEGVCVVQVPRNRIGDEAVVNHTRQRQTGINPFLNASRRRVG